MMNSLPDGHPDTSLSNVLGPSCQSSEQTADCGGLHLDHKIPDALLKPLDGRNDRARDLRDDHGDSESGIYMIRGNARFRFGPGLKETLEVRSGDFVFVPPFAVHQEMNLSPSEPAEMIVVRDRPENVVVPVDLSAGTSRGKRAR